MTSEISAILIWIAANSGYDATDFHPNIAMVEPYTLCQLYGVREQKQCEMLKIKGIYNRDFTIYLRNDFDVSDIEDRSRLAHELQDKWRAQYGLEPKRDMFTIMILEASCEASSAGKASISISAWPCRPRSLLTGHHGHKHNDSICNVVDCSCSSPDGSFHHP